MIPEGDEEANGSRDDIDTAMEIEVNNSRIGDTLLSTVDNHVSFDDVYVKSQRLRSGSYGTVYTCKHKNDSSGQEYAVKILDRRKLKQKDDDAVFREVSILKTCGQENVLHVVRLIDFFVEHDYLYMVQVYAAGGDVFDRLSQRQTYTEADGRDLALILLQTIAHLHSLKIVHRDLKPENLLLKSVNEDSSILVADFGFARQLKDETEKLSTRCGTPAYVSPEVLLGLPYGQTTDLWSIGCILYMLLAGYPPFQGDNHRALFRKIRAGDFCFHDAYWKNVSLPAKQLIANLLTVNPTKRWTASTACEATWFTTMTKQQLSSNDLSCSLTEMKKVFSAKAAWKRAFRALGFASTAKFWKPDAISFSQQLTAWDQQVIQAAQEQEQQQKKQQQQQRDGSTMSSAAATATLTTPTSSSLMSKLPKLVKFDDNYKLETKIRKGSFATVWECRHKVSNELFACKVIQRQNLKAQHDEEVLNEVAIMQSLSGNKYVVQLLDFYEEEDFFYMVMEYMTGGDVFDRIVQYTQYTEQDAHDLSVCLLKAVQSIHKAGLAHRDIKPQNLLLVQSDDNSKIKVGDFGFARRVHTPESLTTRVGTPTYVAPEILKNVPHDERADLWSVGVVIFVLLVGYPPFLEENQTVLFHKIRNGEWEFEADDWKHISDDAKELIKGLLVVDPKERMSVEEALRSKWITRTGEGAGFDLSSVDLSESLKTLREKKHRLRSLARTFMGIGNSLKAKQIEGLDGDPSTGSGGASLNNSVASINQDKETANKLVEELCGVLTK